MSVSEVKDRVSSAPPTMFEFFDPLPAEFPSPSCPEDGILVVTKEARGVEDELREKGWAVVWRPCHLEGGVIANSFVGKPWQPRKPAKILIGRLPYGNAEVPDVADWLVDVVMAVRKDKRVAEVRLLSVDDTPTSMCRNKLGMAALEWEADVLLFVDSDMKPDYLVGQEKNAKPFFQTALDFWWGHTGPCMIGAPYCCGGVDEHPLVFRWDSAQVRPITSDIFKLVPYSRAEAFTMTGIHRAAALPTGLLWVDTGIFKQLPVPWFYYEYMDASCSQKVSTEDVTFTRDAFFHGIPLYCAWDCWAGHWKRRLVGKPESYQVEAVPPFFRQACLRHLQAQTQPLGHTFTPKV